MSLNKRPTGDWADGPVCSNDFSRYRVTWHSPSHALLRTLKFNSQSFKSE
ncbi:MAG: hypothetical protein ACRC8Y_12280 [Chroococcales cyanobacterium]